MRTPVISVVEGTSVLMAAVVRGDTVMAKDLLDILGRHLLLQANRSLVLPVHVAAAKGNVEFLEAAIGIESGVVHCEDDFGCTPAFYAVRGGWLSTLRFLIENANASFRVISRKGMSLLHVACIGGDADVVRYLLDIMGKSAIRRRTKDKSNAVHCAACHGQTHILAQLLELLSKKKRKEVLSARDACGSSALHLAAIGNHADTALFLVEAGADVSQLNRQRQTAREVALLHGHGALARAFADAQAKGTTRVIRTLPRARNTPIEPIEARPADSSTDNESSVGLFRLSSFKNVAKDVCASETRASNHYITRRAPHSTSPIDVHATCHQTFARDSHAQERNLPTSSPRSSDASTSIPVQQMTTLNDGSESAPTSNNDEPVSNGLSTAVLLDRFLKEMAFVLNE